MMMVGCVCVSVCATISRLSTESLQCANIYTLPLYVFMAECLCVCVLALVWNLLKRLPAAILD